MLKLSRYNSENYKNRVTHNIDDLAERQAELNLHSIGIVEYRPRLFRVVGKKVTQESVFRFARIQTCNSEN